MRHKEINEVKINVFDYFKKNPYIHLGADQLIEAINHNVDSDNIKYTMAVDIKIAALALVSDEKLTLDNKWRFHLDESNHSSS